MVASQRLRARLLGTVLSLLAKCGVTADMLTVMSLASGLGFCAAFFYSRPAALALLGLHLLLDGLDGSLARHAGTTSRNGSFTDTCSDQVVIAATTIALIGAEVVQPLPGCIYVFVYTVVVAFSVIRNTLEIPYAWLVRPRILVYAWLVVELYWWPGSLDYVLWICSGVLLLNMLTGFIKIRRRV